MTDDESDEKNNVGLYEKKFKLNKIKFENKGARLFYSRKS